MDGVLYAPLVTRAVDGGADGTQRAVGLVRCEDVRPVVVAAGVDVDAVVVHEGSQLLHDEPVPVGQATQAAAHELYARVRPLHHLGEFAGLLHVIFCLEGSDLPLTVHLVAEAPVPDVVRLIVAVLAPQVCPVGVARAVAVLHPGLRLVYSAGPHVDTDVGLRPEDAAVFDELVRAEAVGLLSEPGEFDLPRALLARTDAVGPVVAADEVSAGPAKDGYVQVLGGFEHIPPVAPFIAKRRVLVEDTAVDAASQVLYKAAEDPPVQRTDRAVGVNLDPRHPLLLSDG